MYGRFDHKAAGRTCVGRRGWPLLVMGSDEMRRARVSRARLQCVRLSGRAHACLRLGIGILVGATACADSDVAAPDLKPLTLVVIGDVTIDSINPAFGQVGLIDSNGRLLVTAFLQNGQYQVNQSLMAGVNVCDGFEIEARINEDTGTRTQTRPLMAASGDCVVSPEMGIKHFVDLDFPFLLGGPASVAIPRDR
jgi:hypothetical protein